MYPQSLLFSTANCRNAKVYGCAPIASTIVVGLTMWKVEVVDGDGMGGVVALSEVEEYGVM